MHFIKGSKRLQLFLTFVPVILILSYAMILLMEARDIYYMTETNRIYLEQESNVKEIVTYTYNEEGESSLITTKGEQLTVSNMNLGLVHKDGDSSYYIEEENILLQSVGSGYGLTFLTSKNVISIILLWLVITILLIGARISGDFEELSQSRWLVIYLVVGFLSAVLFDLIYRLW